MKKFIFISIILLSSSETFSQNNYSFSMLNGFEDSQGITHLTFTSSFTSTSNSADPGCPPVYLTYTDIIHFNSASLSDSVLVSNNPGNGICGGGGIYFGDIKAINNDPKNFIVTGTYSDGFEPYGYIKFLGTGAANTVLFHSFGKIYLDPSRPDSVFLNNDSEFRKVLILPEDIESSEIGLIIYSNFDLPDDSARKYFDWYSDFYLNAFSPFSDSVLFAENSSGFVKSNNLGKSYSVVDEEIQDYYHGNVYFDADSQHIYRVVGERLRVSDQFGEPNSWVERDKPINAKFELETDPINNGIIYAWSDNSNVIVRSVDFSETFATFLSFESNIRGVHKSSSSQSLYILTEKELYLYENEELTSLKKIPVSTEEPKETPGSIKLYQNYPNPFNPTTTISFELNQPTGVKLTVFNALGRTIKVLVDERQSAGLHEINFDASSLSSGMYFYRLETEGFAETKRLTLIK